MEFWFGKYKLTAYIHLVCKNIISGNNLLVQALCIVYYFDQKINTKATSKQSWASKICIL